MFVLFNQQFLKRKEREYEHEMERLAKEKISAQNRILFLKRELAQWDVDFSKILPDQTDINAVKSERSGKSIGFKACVLRILMLSIFSLAKNQNHRSKAAYCIILQPHYQH